MGGKRRGNLSPPIVGSLSIGEAQQDGSADQSEATNAEHDIRRQRVVLALTDRVTPRPQRVECVKVARPAARDPSESAGGSQDNTSDDE